MPKDITGENWLGGQYNWSFWDWLSVHIEKLRAEIRGREVRMLMSSGTGDI